MRNLVYYLIFFFLFFTHSEIIFAQTKTIDSLLSVVKKDNKVDKISALFRLSDIYKYDSTQLAYNYCSDAMQMSEDIKNDTLYVQAINKIGPILLLLNKDEEVLELYKKAIVVSVRENYKNGEAYTYNHFGSYYYKINELDSALNYYLKSVQLFLEINDLKKTAQVYNNIGIIYYRQVLYEKSIEYFIKSLEIKEMKLPSGKRVATDDQIAASLINIGLFYYKLNKNIKTIQYLKRAEKISLKTRNTKYTCIAQVNLGISYNATQKYDSALFYHKSALELAEKMKDEKMLSQVYTGIANVYKNTDNFNEAIKYFSKSLLLHEKLQDFRGKAVVEKNMTELYFNNNDLKNAKIYAHRALNTSLKSNNIAVKKDVFYLLADIYEKNNNFKEAYRYHKLYTALNDSINSINSEKLIKEMEAKFETEKKNTEIINLKTQKVKDQKLQKLFIATISGLFLIAILLIVLFRQRVRTNIVLNKKNRELKQLNSVQNRLMSIISHDLKAPLSAFYSITYSLKTKYDSFSRQEIDNYLARMLNSSVTLKLQLDNMLNWLINQSQGIKADKKVLNLNIITFKVIMVLQEFANERRVIIENTINEDVEIYTDGTLLSIVFNNLISNAIKYSNLNGKIIVSSKKEDEKTIISIKDFGAGMSKSDLENLFVNHDNVTKNNESGTGLGLIVSKDIVEKLGGKIKVESEPNVGTEFFIELT